LSWPDLGKLHGRVDQHLGATILASNITTLIAAAVLFFFGSGRVRGFAVTLSIGIITTVFTAFTLTRLIVAGG
jgi:preprotein translocase subunit SecD